MAELTEIGAMRSDASATFVGDTQISEESSLRTQLRFLRAEIDALSSEPDEDDFISRPTQYAIRLVIGTVKQISHLSSNLAAWPQMSIAPDGRGGLSVEWKEGRKEVRLIAPESEHRRAYIYRRKEQKSDIEYVVSGANLAASLGEIFTF